MTVSKYFPVFDKLSEQEKKLLIASSSLRDIKKGTIVHNSSNECLGLLMVCSGQLRAYISSAEGREITIYRLFENDVCLFSASCMMKNIQFDVTISAEKDTQVWILPIDAFNKLKEQSVYVANFINDIMASRFTEVMWLVEQIMWKSFDKRLAAFLVDECAVEESNVLKITHEQIASHLGTAREVVTRMLKYFQNEGIVKLTRGYVEITDEKRLYELNE